MLNYLQNLIKIFPKYILKVKIKNNHITIYIVSDKILLLINYLKKHYNSRFEILSDLTAVDYPEKSHRFHVIYNLLSIKYNARITLVSELKKTSINSITNIYPVANWLEREVWDLFGIYFINHPDLRRILTDYGFQGHPLRKDFPLTGYKELRYSDSLKKIITEEVELAQAYRNFNFKTPWSYEKINKIKNGN